MRSTSTYLAPYGQSLALHIDLYQLTMGYGYWKKKLAEREAVFHLFFRRWPFGGAFAVAAGLDIALGFIKNLRFSSSDLEYLTHLEGINGHRLFEKEFLDYLSSMTFSLDIDAVPEGTPVFPHEPILRVQGPLIQAQMIESALLNIINFQTLIATKASRIVFAARGDTVVEFGLRRAPGIDGALSASRAAYIGGCAATSNLLAGKLLGIPVKGTHAHSWVMAFDEEEDAFQAFAEVMPDNCIFLIDTYNSIGGLKKVLKAAKQLRALGTEMIGVRLDSGDLAHLSIEIRKLLDEAGFKDAQIMGSNELDEYLINDLKHQGAKISLWGVGTHLVTAKDQSAFDGVYKLSALADSKGQWQYKMKLSEQMVKMTNPGILQVRRFYNEEGYFADMIFDTHLSFHRQHYKIVSTSDPALVEQIESKSTYKDLLEPVMRKGQRVGSSPTLEQTRNYARQEIERFHPSIRRFFNPQLYLTGLEQSLYERKLEMIDELRNKART